MILFNFKRVGLSVLLYHVPLVCMVTFYTKLIIHIRQSALLNLNQYQPAKKSQCFNQEAPAQSTASTVKNKNLRAFKDFSKSFSLTRNYLVSIY